MELQIARIDVNFPIPSYSTAGACCFDVYSRESTIIKTNEVKRLPSNLIIKVPEGYTLLLLPRSSFGKLGLIFPHSVGVIDSDFCGFDDEMLIQVQNISKKNVQIEAGKRIAQAMLVPIIKPSIKEVKREAMGQKNKNRGGFGSTGA